MKSSSLLCLTSPVTKSLLKSVRYILQYNTQYPKKDQAKKQENEQSAQIHFIINEILELKNQISQCIDIVTRTLNNQFLRRTEDAEKRVKH